MRQVSVFFIFISLKLYLWFLYDQKFTGFYRSWVYLFYGGLAFEDAAWLDVELLFGRVIKIYRKLIVQTFLCGCLLPCNFWWNPPYAQFCVWSLRKRAIDATWLRSFIIGIIVPWMFAATSYTGHISSESWWVLREGINHALNITWHHRFVTNSRGCNTVGRFIFFL